MNCQKPNKAVNFVRSLGHLTRRFALFQLPITAVLCLKGNYDELLAHATA